MSPRAVLLALLAVLAAAPAAAQGAGAHQLGLYKVDRHIEIAGEGEVHTIACRPGDIALDGMWRIDDVDDDLDYEPAPPPGFATTGKAKWDLLESVMPERVEAVAVDTYELQFVPLAGGDIRAKLFVTCLPDPTPRAAGHTNAWTAGPLVAGAPVPAVAPETAAASAACPASAIPVAPGFAWSGGSYGNVARRWPAGNAWDWRFVTDQAGGAVTVSHRCLTLRSGPGGGHTHRIKQRLRSETLAVKRGLSTVEVACGELYKGAVAAWDLGAFSGFDELWLLGQDPRPKVRAFRMLNADTVARNAQFGLVCFKGVT